MSRRTTVASATLLIAAVGGGVAALAPPAVAATAAPTVTSGSALGLGATKWAHFTVTGTGFVAGATVTFFKTAAAVTGAAGAASTDVTQDAGTKSTVSTDGKTLTAEVTVTATATESLDISVTNPGGTAVSCYTPPATPISVASDPGCLTIEAAPSGLSFPSGVGVGAMNKATPFTATGLVAGPGMLLSPDSPATFTAPGFTIAAGDKGESPLISVPTTTANKSGNKVILVNGDGGRETDGTITFTGPPSLSAINPTTGDAGHDLILMTTGNFETTAAPTVTFLGKTYTATAFSSGTTFTVDLGVVPATTPGGKVAITVTNADGGTDTETNLLSIIGAPAAPPSVTVSKVGDGAATVSFSAVADANNGGAAIASYNVTTTPDTGPHVVYVNQPLSTTLTGLSNGTSYTASVAATNTDSKTNVSQTGPVIQSVAFTPVAPAAPAPPVTTLPAPTPVVTVVPPTISLKSSAKTINFASPVTISGTLTQGGVPVTSTLVDLQTISAKGARSDTGETATTDSQGHFSFDAVYPSVNTNFGVGVANTTTSGLRVTVTQYLLLTKKTLSKTRSYVITGLGTPGTTDKKATVTLFKVTKTGHRVGTITRTVLAKSKSAKGYSAGISTFTLKSTLKPGKYLVAVAILGTSTNGPVQTKPFTVVVK